MSFSGNLKEELENAEPKAQHCRIAEFDALVTFGGRFISHGDGIGGITLRCERTETTRKFFTLAEKAFKIKKDFEEAEKRDTFSDDAQDPYLPIGSAVGRIRQAVTAQDKLSRSCCRRSYLRGAFLAGGTISDPERYYHLEFNSGSEKKAEELMTMINEFGLSSKMVRRKENWVVYLKEGDQIAEMLRLMGAGRTLMEFENIRILRERRGSVNRRVNCETANIQKTAEAAVRQVDDIVYLKEIGLWDSLSDNLKEIGEARLMYPDVSLQELGKRVTPPVSKSAVNHRLRKIQETAAEHR